MTDFKMPSFAQLQAQLNATFSLRNAEGFTVSAELIDVYEGIAMNARYVCFSMQLALPPDVNLPQAVYAVHVVNEGHEVSNGAEEWPLLLTPVMPCEDDRARMEAVFHVAAPVPSKAVAASTKPVSTEEYEPTGSLVT